MRRIPSVTDASESTSMAEIVIGSFSCVAIRASSGARSGLRIVAATVRPALPKANAVAMPIPELVPVIRTEAMGNLLLCEDRSVRARQTEPLTLVPVPYLPHLRNGAATPLEVGSNLTWQSPKHRER